MKKHLIVIGMTLMLLAVGFSGCTDEQTGNLNTDIDQVEILSYNMSVNGYEYNKWIEVTGTAKNNADTMLSVTIRGKFYDENNVYLGENNLGTGRKNFNYNVPASYAWNFSLEYYGEYIDNVEYVTFEISASKI